MGYRIKELREKRKWSQEELAHISGVSRTNIIRLEGEKEVVTTTDTLQKLADAFGVSIKYLFLPWMFNKLYKNGAFMRVINVLADGTEIDDLSLITVPKDNLIYEVCADIAKGEYEEGNKL